MATKRQKKAAEILCKVLRDLKAPTGFTYGKMLKLAGYSDSVSRKPSLVIRSQGFSDLVSKEFPDFYFP